MTVRSRDSCRLQLPTMVTAASDLSALAQKKGTSEEVPFVTARSAYEPRQEPGRYFWARVVPSVEEPQRHPYRPLPMSFVEPCATAGRIVPAALKSGRSVTCAPSTVVLIPVTVAVTTPFASVAKPCTYFDAMPLSQPQLFAPGAVPPV